jgi:hypothetical protein
VGGVESGIACTLDSVPVACNESEADLNDLSVGNHVFTAVASGVGGENSVSTSWNTLTPPPPAPAPEVALSNVPANGSYATSADISFILSGGEATSIECELDNVSVSCNADGAELSNLGVGSHTFEVDVSGVGGTNSATVAFTISQAPAPTIFLTSAPPTASADTSDVIEYSIGGDVDTIACTLDGVSISCSTNQAVITGLGVGAHTFVATASGAGGSGVATDVFMVVAAPAPAATPVKTVTAPTPAATALSWSRLSLIATKSANCKSKTRDCASAPAFTFDLNQAATLNVNLTSQVRGRTRVVAHLEVSESAGAGEIRLPTQVGGRALAAGTYKLSAYAQAQAQRSSVFTQQLHLR